MDPPLKDCSGETQRPTCADFPRRMTWVTACLAVLGPPRNDRSGETQRPTCADFPRRMSWVTACLAALGPPRNDRSGETQRPTCADFPRRMSWVTACLAALGPPRNDRSGETCSSLISPSVSCFTRCSILALPSTGLNSLQHIQLDFRWQWTHHLRWWLLIFWNSGAHCVCVCVCVCVGVGDTIESAADTLHCAVSDAPTCHGLNVTFTITTDGIRLQRFPLIALPTKNGRFKALR